MLVRAIIVAQEIDWCLVPREGFYNLLGQPLRYRMSGDGKPEQLSSTVPMTRNANRFSKARVGTTQRSIAATASAWLAKNVRHVCDGGPWR